MANEKLVTQTIRLTEEQVRQLDEVAEKKFRGSSRNKAIMYLIEDAWKEEGSNK